MASSSSSHQHNVEYLAFSGIEPDTKRRKISESSRLFDVFINHRGPDAKETLAVPLYNSLQELGLGAFLDKEEMEVGEYFPSTIETAIQSASAHIAIFSQRYAESAWCMAELDLMLQSGAKIFPIFYGVKPSELRHIQSGAYADAFTKYKVKGRYLRKLETWEKALQSASFFTGLEINSADSFRDSEAFNNLVLNVKNEVERTKPLFVAQHPVALHKLVKDFESQCLEKLVHDFEKQCGLNIQRSDHTKIVGIFGMGGVGKTTLAKELFNRKRSNYVAKCFLFDVREKSSRFGLPSLQAELIKELFPRSPTEFRSREEGINYVRNRLGRSTFLSFLIVVDDIDHVKQLDTLCLMDMAKIAHNSLVIVTTRDVGVLTSAGITNRYNLKGLNRDDGKELFCRHSFGQPNPASGYENLVDAFLDVCRGLPLSLQILGRHVNGRPLDYWEFLLRKVHESLHPDIKGILQISFDALDRVEKQIFMDIACFFIGKSKNTAIRVWEGSGWGARYALETLKDRCLVEEEQGTDGLPWEDEPVVLKMHDHLRDLGREMSKEPNSPRRHWSPNYCKHLETKGFETILAQTKGRCFHSFYDTSMGAQITYFIGQSEECAETSSLLWLQLHLYYTELPSIPPWIPLQNLQCLRIKYGWFKRLWESNAQVPSQLKELHIRTTNLEEFPDFSGISNNLERVVLHARDFPIEGWSLLESLKVYPRNLILASSTLRGELDCSNRGYQTTSKSSHFNSLVIENFIKGSDELSFCNVRESTALECPLSNLESLDINHQVSVTKILICGNYCPSLLSLKIHDMAYLTEMNLLRADTLKCLEIKTCGSLKRLPETSHFRNLVECKISECPELKELNLANLTSLEKLAIENCEKLKILSGASNLRKLLKLDIIECLELQELACFGSLTCLKYVCILSCGKLENIHLEGCEKLKDIDIKRCWKLQNVSLSTTLISLSAEGCKELQRVAGSSYLTELRGIYISWFEELPSLPRMRCLEVIEIDFCLQVIEIKELRIGGMQFLERITFDRNVKVKYLELNSCQNLETIMFGCEELRELRIQGCPKLEELPVLKNANCLEMIRIDGCGKFDCLILDECQNLRSVSGNFELKNLSINQCPELEELERLSSMSSLEVIDISYCTNVKSITLPTTLTSLSICHCGDLQRISASGDFMEISKKLTVRYCPVLEELPMFPMQSCTEEIEIEDCEKLQNITMPTTLTSLSIYSCGDLQRISATGDFMEISKKLTVGYCPVLEELPIFPMQSCTEEIEIEDCKKLQNITMPTKVSNLSICVCRDLQRISATGDFMGISGQLTIRTCPMLEELPMFPMQSCTEDIKIYDCKKLQNITMPTKVSNLSIDHCRDLQRISATGDFMGISGQLAIRNCPMLEELPMFPMQSCTEDIDICECDKLQNITLPTKVSNLSIDHCRDLQRISATGDFMGISGQLAIRNCPMLEELPMFPMQSCTEDIDICKCDRLQNITLPTKVSNLSFGYCEDLQRMSATGDFMGISGQLTIRKCPMLEELPMFLMQSCIENIDIWECEKLQNITLPTKFSNLSFGYCEDLRRISATGDFMGISGQLTIRNCPMLEELPMFPMQSCIEEIEIYESEKVENITGVEELRVLKWIKLSYCSKALIQNCIHKLKTLPLDGMCMSGIAVDGAESSLKESLFSENNISVETVIEIGSHEWPDLSVTTAIIVCFVVVVDGFDTDVDYINLSLEYYERHFEVEEGESIITWVYTCNYWNCRQIVEMENILRKSGILKKTLTIKLKKDEEFQSILRIIADKLHHL